MSMPGLCIRRPITVLMFYAGVLIFGGISLASLNQELFPSIAFPKLSIVTHYENAAPEEIETLITKPIEEAVGSTPGLRGMTSTSREGLSVVVAEFGWNQKMDFAALNVREKIDLIKARLPRDAEEPTVLKFNPFEKPVLKLSISSDKRSAVRLKRFVEKWFKDEIEKINGVASAALSGGEDEEILVEVDQGRLMASNIGVNDISKALSASNLNYPGGTIKESFYEYLVRTMGEFKTVADIGKVSLNKKDDNDRRPGEDFEITPDLIQLRDIADITRTVQERTSFSRYDHRESITISVQKQANANTIQVVDMIHEKLRELQKQMPDDIQTVIIFNQAEFIKDAINGVRDAAIIGGILVFCVLMIFLRNVLLAILVVVITPVTIIWTFVLMHFFGITVNIISLAGIAISVGLLVDSAIVVIENVFRRVKANPGADFKKETEKACTEVMLPLMASMLTTIVVWLPLIFVVGVVGQLIKDLAWVIVITLILSFFVAFSLLPVLIVKFSKSIREIGSLEGAEGTGMFGRLLALLSKPLDALRHTYTWTLPGFLRHKGKYLFIILVIFFASVLLLTRLDSVMMPKVDQGQFTIKLGMPVGTRVEITDQITGTLENYLAKLEEVEHVAVIVGSQKGTSTQDAIQRIGSHQSEVTVTLKERRFKSTDDIVQEIRKDLASGPLRKSLRGARISFDMSDELFSMGDDETAPIIVDIKGNRMDVLKSLSDRVQKRLSNIPGIFDVTNSYPESSPETKIIVNKDKASFYRLSVTDLATAAHISIRGIVATKLKEESREIPIRVVLKKRDRDAISKLPHILMHSPLGISVPLDEVVTFETGRGPSEIKRIGQERTVRVFAKIYERPLKDVTADVQRMISELRIQDTYHVQLAGASIEVQESFSSLRFALILSIVLVYMIMAAQFESYYQPFIIMFTVPLALIGVAWSLWITLTPLSVMVLLGIMFLGGMVVNNGIIIIDFINQRLEEGMSVKDATIKACLVRFRPILMTASTSILGFLPLALGLGRGAKLLQPMAITQMGGLAVATFLTLLVIPAIYLGSTNFRAKFRGRSTQDEEKKVGISS